MSYLHKEYIEHDGKTIKFAITFNRYRTNWATSEPKKIGYQVNVLPVKRTVFDGYTVEESGAFTGFLDCLLEIDRQSKKRLETAIKVLESRKEMYLNHFKNE